MSKETVIVECECGNKKEIDVDICLEGSIRLKCKECGRVYSVDVEYQGKRPYDPMNELNDDREAGFEVKMVEIDNDSNENNAPVCKFWDKSLARDKRVF